MQIFFEERVSLIEASVSGYIMDWATIFSNNLTTQIHNYRKSAMFLKERLLLSL